MVWPLRPRTGDVGQADDDTFGLEFQVKLLEAMPRFVRFFDPTCYRTDRRGLFRTCEYLGDVIPAALIQVGRHWHRRHTESFPGQQPQQIATVFAPAVRGAFSSGSPRGLCVLVDLHGRAGGQRLLPHSEFYHALQERPMERRARLRLVQPNGARAMLRHIAHSLPRRRRCGRCDHYTCRPMRRGPNRGCAVCAVS